jgi:hypothetical protein
MIAMMVIGVLPLTVNAADYGTIALKPSPINIDAGDETSVLPSWPDFALTVEVTNVTNCVAVAFSLTWNSSLFTCTGAAKGDFLEGNPGGTYWSPPQIESDKLHEAAYTQLATYSPVTVPDGTWGLVATVSFTYIGPTPPLGDSINTQINFTDYNGDALMRTYWAEKQVEPVPVKNSFSPILPCQFNYQVVETLVHDVEGFSVVTVSNTNVSTPILNITQKELRFNVTGQAGMMGFCNVTVPVGLMSGIYNVTVDGASADSLTITDNTTHTFVYFTYTLANTLQIAIQGTYVVPEFQTLTFLVLLMIATIVTTILGKKVWLIRRRERIVSP